MTRAAAALLAALLAPACAAHEDAHDQPARSAADSAAGATVDMPRSYLFRPETLVVEVGTSVQWRNSDVFTHAASVAGVGATGPVRPGGHASLRFERAGTFAYECPFHPQTMKGVVVVR